MSRNGVRLTIVFLLCVTLNALSAANANPENSDANVELSNVHSSLTSPMPSSLPNLPRRTNPQQAIEAELTDYAKPIVAGVLSGALVVIITGWKWDGSLSSTPYLVPRMGLFVAILVAIHFVYTFDSQSSSYQPHPSPLNPNKQLQTERSSDKAPSSGSAASAAPEYFQILSSSQLQPQETYLDKSDVVFRESYLDPHSAEYAASSPETATYTYRPSEEGGEADVENFEAMLRMVSPPTGYEAGPMPRPACQRDIDTLQRHIQSHQHPVDCRKVRLLVRRWWWPFGYFAGLNVDADHLHHALVTDRVYVDLAEDSYLKDICDTKGHTCVFKPVSNCTAAHFDEEEVCYEERCFDTARVISFDKVKKSQKVPCTTAPDDARDWCKGYEAAPARTTLSEIGHKLGLKRYGNQFFRTEIVRFMYRPNALLFDYTVGVMRRFNLTSRMISVHVRHGDFVNGGIQFPTIAYAHVLRRLVEITGISKIFIGSDDERVFTDLPNYMRQEFAGHPGTPELTFAFIPHREAGVISDASKIGDEPGTLGLPLSAQLLIFSMSEAFLGTRVSQQGSLVQDFAPLDCTRPKIFFDMNADLWFDGLYFSSRVADRHAGREWMCPLEPPAPTDTNNAIYTWKGGKNLTPGGCHWCAGIEP